MTDRLKTFLTDARGAATAIAAAAIAVMTVAGTALVVDHAWLVDQRDVLKAAVDAAAVAATVEMQRQVSEDPEIGDTLLTDRLTEVAERYVLLNLAHLPAARLDRAEQTLQVKLDANRDSGTVRITASGDFGGTLLAGNIPLLGGLQEVNAIQTEAGVESSRVPVEVVLAIDISGSMARALDGTASVPEDETRMALVKQASRALVAALDPNPEHRIAVGLVPWHRVVRLNDFGQDRWERFQWAVYPSSRSYGVPYQMDFRNLPDPPSVTQNLAADAPEPWSGCLDDHRITGSSTAEPLTLPDLNTPPQRAPFAQYFYPALLYHAYECASDPLPNNYYIQFCYTQVVPKHRRRQIHRAPQHGCDDAVTAMQSLTPDRATIEARIDELQPSGDKTYSTLGISWAHRMLLPEWKRVWGGTTHPLDPESSSNTGLRKAIVLLTDGHDNFCGSPPSTCTDSPLGMDREEPCTAAKMSGHEIFVVAAMPPDAISSEFANALRECSSEADFPDGSYVFINNETQDQLQSAFLSIASQLLGVRKTY